MTIDDTKESNTPDIRIDTQFLHTLKTRKLIRALGDHGVICILRLWCYVGERHPKGVMHGMTEDDIEEVSGWGGNKGIFVGYCRQKMWIETTENGEFAIHDWSKHQPWIFRSDKRKQAAIVGANARWNKDKSRDVDAERNADRIKPQCSSPFLSFPFLESKHKNIPPHADRARKILAYYEETIREDRPSRSRAQKNIVKLLTSGMSPETLWECVNLYVDDALKNEPKYRKVAGNFFGRDEIYKSYFDEAQKIVAANHQTKGETDDETVRRKKAEPGRDSSTRGDAIREMDPIAPGS